MCSQDYMVWVCQDEKKIDGGFTPCANKDKKGKDACKGVKKVYVTMHSGFCPACQRDNR